MKLAIASIVAVCSNKMGSYTLAADKNIYVSKDKKSYNKAKSYIFDRGRFCQRIFLHIVEILKEVSVQPSGLSFRDIVPFDNISQFSITYKKIPLKHTYICKKCYVYSIKSFKK